MLYQKLQEFADYLKTPKVAVFDTCAIFLLVDGSTHLDFLLASDHTNLLTKTLHFEPKLYIPSTINTWLRLWNTKLILRALAYFDPKLKKYTLGQKLTVMPLRLKSF